MKILGKILASLYTIIFGIAFFVFIMAILIGQLLTPEYYATVIKDIDFSSYKVKDLDLFSEKDLQKYAEDTTLEEYLVYELVDCGIREKAAKKIVNDDKVRELFGEFLGNVIYGTISNEKIERLTIEEVKVAFKKYDVSDEICQDIVDIINEEYENLERGDGNE